MRGKDVINIQTHSHDDIDECAHEAVAASKIMSITGSHDHKLCVHSEPPYEPFAAVKQT